MGEVGLVEAEESDGIVGRAHFRVAADSGEGVRFRWSLAGRSVWLNCSSSREVMLRFEGDPKAGLRADRSHSGVTGSAPCGGSGLCPVRSARVDFEGSCGRGGSKL